MSFENPFPKAATKETGESAKLKELEDQLSKLNLIDESLELERRGVQNAWIHESEAKANLEKTSAAVTEEGLRGEGVTDEHRGALEKASALLDESVRFARESESSPTMDFDTRRAERRGNPLPPEFVSALTSVGVSAYEDDKTLLESLSVRRRELESQIRNLKLETPGGKEEMTIEALRKSGLLADDGRKLKSFKDYLMSGESIGFGENPHFLSYAAQELRKLIGDTEIVAYPQEVQRSVIKQLTNEALRDMEINPGEMEAFSSAIAKKILDS